MEQEELSRLCNQSKDKSYIKFLTDEGWKCNDEVDAQVRYGRLRKAMDGIPLTLEEFTAELETGPTDLLAKQLYNALIPLVAKGALTPFDLYQYARFRWCRHHPEAVIACQTGPSTWKVNTCGEECQEECAKLRINSVWGFEASRIQLQGTPYYDATDWNFIRFRCGPLNWLMKDGALYQIYE